MFACGVTIYIDDEKLQLQILIASTFSASNTTLAQYFFIKIEFCGKLTYIKGRIVVIN